MPYDEEIQQHQYNNNVFTNSQLTIAEDEGIVGVDEDTIHALQEEEEDLIRVR